MLKQNPRAALSAFVQDVNAAMALATAGKAREARDRVAALARVAPPAPAAHEALWQALDRLGETDAALVHLRKAAELAGPDARLWMLLVGNLVKAGHKGRARTMAQKAPLKGAANKALLDLSRSAAPPSGPDLGGVDKDVVRAVMADIAAGKLLVARQTVERLLAEHGEPAFMLNLRGVIAMQEIRLEEAEGWFQKALAKVADFDDARRNLGLSLLRQGKDAEAVEALIQVWEHSPDAPDILTQLAEANLSLGRERIAHDFAKRAIKANPNDLEAVLLLALCDRKLGHHKQALDGFRRVERALGTMFEHHAALADALLDVEGLHAAFDYLRSRDPRTPDIAHKLATMTAQQGRIDEAVAMLRDILAADPNQARAAKYLTRIIKVAPDDPVVAVLESVFNSAEHGPKAQADAGFALAKVRLDAKDNKGSFEAMRQANALLRGTITYDVRQSVAAFAETERVWTPDALRKVSAAGDPKPRPIFIIGLPRCGSTMTEQIVGSHPGVRTLGEDRTAVMTALGQNVPTLEAVHAVAGLGGAAIRAAGAGGFAVTDKFLDNFRCAGLLAAAFPRARFVHVRRDPRGNCLSIFQNQLIASGHPYSMDLRELGHYFAAYARLMAHWRGVLGEQLIEVRYEDMVADPEPQTRALIAALGLPWDDACLSPEMLDRQIRTLSIVQAREKVHARSAERWRVFETELAPLIEVLREEGALGPDD